jgi:hypothetical protein
MPTTILITVVPIDRRGRYRAYLGARLLVAGTRMPLLDAARELARLGYSDDVILIMRHAGASHDAMQGRLGAAAGLTVDEFNGTRFARWKPFQASAVAPPIAPIELAATEGHRRRNGGVRAGVVS